MIFFLNIYIYIYKSKSEYFGGLRNLKLLLKNKVKLKLKYYIQKIEINIYLINLKFIQRIKKLQDKL